MSYKVDPGLYALATPDAESPVLVSANYKMSFDRLRESMEGRSAWILVLDTDGINVWCAAGKGSFGAEELADRVSSSGLSQVVNHRVLIVPQLGAPGISAHQVRKLSGFKVIYGPVRAADLPAFLDSGLKAKPEMRIKTFTLAERLALIPVELVHALKTFLMILPFLLVLNGFAGAGSFFENALTSGCLDAAGLLTGILAGCVISPALLPWLPGRAFAAKGILPGLAGALLYILLRNSINTVSPAGIPEIAAWLLIISAVSAYLAMNFTGCSTFTSLSGVKKEMRWAVPAEIAAMAAGILLWITSRFFVYELSWAGLYTSKMWQPWNWTATHAPDAACARLSVRAESLRYRTGKRMFWKRIPAWNAEHAPATARHKPFPSAPAWAVQQQ